MTGMTKRRKARVIWMISLEATQDESEVQARIFG